MAEAAEQTLDYLSMSDEDMLNAPAPTVGQQAVSVEPVAPEPASEPVAEIEQDALEAVQAAEDEAEDGTRDRDENAADDQDGVDPAQPAAKKATQPVEGLPDDAGNRPKAAESGESGESAEIDYKAEYEKLLAPFKANGREIRINGVSDAIALMQMGANYNKKMAALKPNLKLMKMLENNNLLSEEKISFLIDLEKKNPNAINKLVKDSGLDPMDLDADKASEYKQTAYTVDDREIELDTVLDELQNSPGYNQTLDVVGNKWDAASKQVIANAPQLLRVINDHVQSGIYDLISKEVENERLFGRLNGLSDIEAYRQIGDALHARGAFNHLAQGSAPGQRQLAPGSVVAASKPKPASDDRLRDKKRAASPTKPAATTPLPADFNPLALSDEEFGKLVNKHFL